MAHSQLGSSRNHEDKNENLSGIPVFWATASIAPPVEWSIWLDSFFLASDLKEGCQTRLLLQEPTAVTHELLPKPELPTDLQMVKTIPLEPSVRHETRPIELKLKPYIEKSIERDLDFHTNVIIMR